MTSGENIPTPTLHELKKLMSLEGDDPAPIEDMLVYTALGMFEDDDYITYGKILIDHGSIEEVAKAEARLQHIEDFDRRQAEIIAKGKDLQHIRKFAIHNHALTVLSFKNLAYYARVFEDEREILEIEEIDAYQKPDSF